MTFSCLSPVLKLQAFMCNHTNNSSRYIIYNISLSVSRHVSELHGALTQHLSCLSPDLHQILMAHLYRVSDCLQACLRPSWHTYPSFLSVSSHASDLHGKLAIVSVSSHASDLHGTLIHCLCLSPVMPQTFNEHLPLSLSPVMPQTFMAHLSIISVSSHASDLDGTLVHYFCLQSCLRPSWHACHCLCLQSCLRPSWNTCHCLCLRSCLRPSWHTCHCLCLQSCLRPS